VLRALIRPGDTVLDIGANVGFYTVLAGRWVGEVGRVVAFEPDPVNLGLLRRNIVENGLRNVELRAAAAGARTEHARFSLDRATGATGRVGGGLTQGESTVGTGRVEIVPIECLAVDDVVAELGLRPHVIKLDIEGYECEAIRGASRTLSAARPAVVSELNGPGGTEVLQTFVDLDYTIWDVESGRIVEPGDERPFMIAALPREAAGDELGRRLVAALPRPRA
jgi:FkbM family methyltransferase